MDRIRDIQPPGSPGVPFSPSPLAIRLLSTAVAGRGACLIWTGYVDIEGYGRTRVDGKHQFAHRATYEAMVQPVPAGLQIDHVCHTAAKECNGGNDCMHRRCINPAHLEPVTPLENSRRSNKARKTHCTHGHPFDESNTYFKSNGTRRCKECQRGWTRSSAARRHAPSRPAATA